LNTAGEEPVTTLNGLGLITPRAVLGVVAILVASPPFPAGAQEGGLRCQPAGTVVQVPGLVEGSGLALSRRISGGLWTHNDSGKPVLFALDARGRVTGRLEVAGAEVEDWEAIAVGSCGSGSCLYIGDIGDNGANRRRVTVYRLPEPDVASGTAAVADVFHATYPDGPHDAETLLVDSDSRLHIVTKEKKGGARIYRFPSQLKSGTTSVLERVGNSANPDGPSLITDGAVSPNGRWAVLRTRSDLAIYRAADLLAGRWHAATHVDLAALKESQGEGVAVANDLSVFLVGEGRGKGQAGTFARMACAPAN
jgi:hypothetical protein